MASVVVPASVPASEASVLQAKSPSASSAVKKDALVMRRSLDRIGGGLKSRWIRLAAAGLLACSTTPEVRAQSVLRIDTDAPVVPSHGVPVARVDTLRIDVLEPSSTAVRETREYAVDHVDAWPFSLGIVGPARVRIRLFAARRSTTGLLESGVRVRDPLPEVALDRLVELEAPSEGVRRVRVAVSLACMGRAVDLVRGRTCVDGSRLDAPAAEGLVEEDPPRAEPSRVGTSPLLAERPCLGPENPERPCIPGGLDVMGDPSLAGVGSLEESPTPLRVAMLSPLRMDRLEYTVGRYLRAVARGFSHPEEPSFANEKNVYCTYRGPLDGSTGALPLNCASQALAEALCAFDSGRLPSEAEWEHAATGRGQGRLYPWGDRDPTCCTTSLSRSPDPKVGAACPRGTVEPAGLHDGRDCTDGDVSRDGVQDLAGSLLERVQDDFMPVAECGFVGVASDPICRGGARRLMKSADFTSGFFRARSALRVVGNVAATDLQGFRCVYPGDSP